MNNLIWIVLIIALAVVIVLYLFRDKLRSFSISANEKGLNAELRTQQENNSDVGQAAAPEKQPGINISGNQQVGTDNKILVSRNDVNVTDNLQYGDKHSIAVETKEQDGE